MCPVFKTPPLFFHLILFYAISQSYSNPLIFISCFPSAPTPAPPLSSLALQCRIYTFPPVFPKHDSTRCWAQLVDDKELQILSCKIHHVSLDNYLHSQCWKNIQTASCCVTTRKIICIQDVGKQETFSCKCMGRAVKQHHIILSSFILLFRILRGLTGQLVKREMRKATTKETYNKHLLLQMSTC